MADEVESLTNDKENLRINLHRAEEEVWLLEFISNEGKLLWMTCMEEGFLYIILSYYILYKVKVLFEENKILDEENKRLLELLKRERYHHGSDGKRSASASAKVRRKLNPIFFQVLSSHLNYEFCFQHFITNNY